MMTPVHSYTRSYPIFVLIFILSALAVPPADGLSVPKVPTVPKSSNGVHIPTPSALTSSPTPIISATTSASTATGTSTRIRSSKPESAAAIAAAFEQGEKLLQMRDNDDEEEDCNHALIRRVPVDVNHKDNTLGTTKEFLLAPQLTYQKFLTMQEKRVVVSFRFTDVPYLRPYFLTFASKLKRTHSDILIEKRVLPMVDSAQQPIFEVLVDGKTVIGSNRRGSTSSKERIVGGRVDVTNTQSVFVSMEQLGHAIAKARRRRRPTTSYGEDDRRKSKLWQRTYVLRNTKQQQQRHDKNSDSKTNKKTSDSR